MFTEKQSEIFITVDRISCFGAGSMGQEEIKYDEFADRMRVANENAEVLIGYEPSVRNVILYLSMCVAVDCSDIWGSEESLDEYIDVLKNISQEAKNRKSEWNWKDLTLDDRAEPEGNDRLELFMDAQGFLYHILDECKKEYGEPSENNLFAFEETSNMVVYMLSNVCVRCDRTDEALEYACSSIRKTFKFISEECTLVPEEELEKKEESSRE